MNSKLSATMLLLSMSVLSYGQQIKIADFLKLRNSTQTIVETTLSTFDIQLYDTYELNSGKTQLSFRSTLETPSVFTMIDFLYLQDAEWNNRLSFQTAETNLVKKYLEEMKTLGYKFVNKKIVDRRIYDVYSDGKNTIELIRSQIKSDLLAKKYYIFAFYNADEYKYAFAAENKTCSVQPSKKNSMFDN